MLFWFAFITSVFYLFKVNKMTSKQRPVAQGFQVVIILETDKVNDLM